MSHTSLDALEQSDAELAAQVWALHRSGHDDWHVIADSLDLSSASHARGLYQLHIRTQHSDVDEQPTLF